MQVELIIADLVKEVPQEMRKSKHHVHLKYFPYQIRLA